MKLDRKTVRSVLILVMGAVASARSSAAQTQLVIWGYNFYGIENVPALPPGLTYVEVSLGGIHAVARRSDGLCR